ncbi:MAG: protein kinase domain-containing protein [Myxococcaceae bacterium]
MYDDIDPRNLPAGTVVDGYTLLGKLGGGGMGEIYRVQRGRELFALKLQGERLTEAMDPAKREELEARSRREAAVLLSLTHPNILGMIGSGRWPDRGGYLYLITELVAGEPLDRWHEHSQPSLRQLARVFERVADALDYMHRAGIYHRDLKDPNVLVREDGTPVVIDLGIARSPAAYTLTRVGAVLGTTTHLSPGVCRYLVGEKSRAYRFGAHDDLHALGFMLYERLTGTPPFRQRSDVEWPEFDYYRQVMEHVPPAPRVLSTAVPEVLSALTMRLLAKTPETGFRDAAALRDELDKALLEAPSAWDTPFPVPRGLLRKDLTRSAPVMLPQPAEADTVERPPLNATVKSLPHATPRVALGQTERAIAALQPSHDGPALPPLEFRPPTLDGPPAFVPPEEAVGAVSAPTRRSAFNDTALLQVAAQLGAETRPPRRMGALGLAFLGAALLLVAALVVKALAERPLGQAKSLLERYQEELAAEPTKAKEAGQLSVSPVLPAQPTSLLPEAPPPPTASSAGEAAAPSPRGSGRQNSPPSEEDAKAIQAELERAYGKRRPTLPGKLASPSPGQPSWVKGVELVDAKPPPSGERKLGGRYGDHLRFELRSNLDSRLCGSGAVEAVLVRPYLVNGETVLPVRTLAYGMCAAQGARFLVTFNRLRLPDGSEVHVDGVAMDVADGKPGLQAGRRIASGGGAQESVGGAVVRGAVSTALASATGGGSVGAQVAGNAGQSVLTTRQQASSGAGEDAILLDAGAGIDVFLRQSF